MSLYMIDTDISSYIIKDSDKNVIRRLRKVPIESVCISVITKCELMFGAEASARFSNDNSALSAYLRAIPVLDFPDGAAKHYADIRATLKQKGQLIGPNDLFIAAHARFLNAILVSNNIREFSRVSGLRLETWV